MTTNLDWLLSKTRRHFLSQCSLGLAGMALGSQLAPNALGAGMKPRPGHIPATARRVIYLHMAGSPSQLDLFDFKPVLMEYNGKACPDEFIQGKRFAFIKGVPNLLGSPFRFKQHGQSGAWFSENLPWLAQCADDLAIIKSVHTDQFNHAPAQLLMLTGTPQSGGASVGSWATYGLGSDSENLPSFVVLSSGGKTPSAGKSLWSSGFLPTVYQGVQCRTKGDPVLYLSNPPGLDRAGRRMTLDALNQLNDLHYKDVADPEILTRMAQYELAFRMQMTVPEVMDISKEPGHILDLYGARPGHISSMDNAADPRTAAQPNDAAFANNCLLARRLLENGVRFVQLFDWGWDHHGVSPGEDIRNNLPIKSRQIDKPIYALITDLKQRGLLDDTLLIWGGEFGRTPMQQNNRPDLAYVGRDHHPLAFTMFMAGGGIRGGISYGSTDELGYFIHENPVHVRDIQATILHCLGLDPFQFSFPFQGLDNRFIGPDDTARLHPQLMS